MLKANLAKSEPLPYKVKSYLFSDAAQDNVEAPWNGFASDNKSTRLIQ